MDKIPSKVAALLGYPDYACFTGHAWRRTTATIAASRGMTLPQIKQITGHKSDTVVQGYIDSSDFTKRKAADSLALKAPQHHIANRSSSTITTATATPQEEDEQHFIQYETSSLCHHNAKRQRRYSRNRNSFGVPPAATAPPVNQIFHLNFNNSVGSVVMRGDTTTASAGQESQTTIGIADVLNENEYNANRGAFGTKSIGEIMLENEFLLT
jgi:hypothetical protein